MLFKDQQYDQVQVGSGKRVMVECTHRTNVCVHLCTSRVSHATQASLKQREIPQGIGTGKELHH